MSYTKEQRKANKLRAYRREYARTHRAQIKASTNKWRAKNPDYSRNYYATHKELRKKYNSKADNVKASSTKTVAPKATKTIKRKTKRVARKLTFKQKVIKFFKKLFK